MRVCTPTPDMTLFSLTIVAHYEAAAVSLIARHPEWTLVPGPLREIVQSALTRLYVGHQRQHLVMSRIDGDFDA